MRRIFTLSVALLFWARPASAQHANYDVTYYGLDISFDDEAEAITGHLQFQARSLIDSLNLIELDLHHTMHVDSMSPTVIDYNHAEDKLFLSLDHACDRGENVIFSVYYHGSPEKPGAFSSPLGFYSPEENRIFRTESSPYYAHYWMPCKDTPSDKADSADFWITVDESLTAASNGKLVKVQANDDHTRTFHWKVMNPIATYLMTITIAEYNILSDYYVNASGDSLLLQYYLFANRDEEQIIPFETLKNMIRILEKYYGAYPFYEEKYAIAEYVTRWAAMEYQTLSCFNSYALVDEETILHELAHQWWGDCVSPANFHHTWISEGLAVFSEALYWGEIRREQHYHEYFEDLYAAYYENDILYRRDLSTPLKVYPSLIYHKGAWVFRMLRNVVGDSIFWKGLQEFRKRHEYGSATTDDLQQAFEVVANQPLNWFFEQWIYKPSFPQYNYGWSQQKTAGGYKVTGFLDRIKTDFMMPVDISIYSGNEVFSEVVWVRDSSAVFEFISPNPVEEIVPDEGNLILANFHHIEQPDIRLRNYRFDMNNDSLPGSGRDFVNGTLVLSVVNKGLNAHHVEFELNADPVVRLYRQKVMLDTMMHNEKVYISYKFSITRETKTDFIRFNLIIVTSANFAHHHNLNLDLNTKIRLD
ncbi:hypothetical protein GF337_18135 [candidate division KSB1 bacterium]|nr:hypothetical protein [candidate division KSB1 bacterium]